MTTHADGRALATAACGCHQRVPHPRTCTLPRAGTRARRRTHNVARAGSSRLQLPPARATPRASTRARRRTHNVARAGSSRLGAHLQLPPARATPRASTRALKRKHNVARAGSSRHQRAPRPRTCQSKHTRFRRTHSVARAGSSRLQLPPARTHAHALPSTQRQHARTQVPPQRGTRWWQPSRAAAACGCHQRVPSRTHKRDHIRTGARALAHCTRHAPATARIRGSSGRCRHTSPHRQPSHATRTRAQRHTPERDTAGTQQRDPAGTTVPSPCCPRFAHSAKCRSSGQPAQAVRHKTAT